MCRLNLQHWGSVFRIVRVRTISGVPFRLCATYPYRGLKGAVGTRMDQVTLLGSVEKAEQLDRVMEHLGATANWDSVGHSTESGLGSGIAPGKACFSPIQFCQDLRIMAGHELLGEGSQKVKPIFGYAA